MLGRLAHRGPDGSGAWHEGPVGVGHRMLHTTPESLNEHQPIIGARGELVLTADARLDNREELCSLLSAPRSVTDAELILAAYERWGERCPEHLLGDFAFVAWDGRRRALFCARDHFGVKPFYYHHRPGRLFAFASEIKALLALPDVPRRVNETRVADYLASLFEDKEITFYQEIVRLPPAHWMLVDREGIRRHQYWALDAERQLRMKSDAEYAELFRATFTEAVRCRLRSAFPVGSMLSGGLDSSSIVCVARKLLMESGRGSLHTFSAIFPDLLECDEQEFIDAVVAGGGADAHRVRGDRLSPASDLDTMLAQQDEPFYGPNLFLHEGLYAAARATGVRAILDGLDGDTTVSHGLGYLRELAGSGRWLRLIREVRGLSRQLKVPPRRILVAKVVKPILRSVARRARVCPADLVAPEFARCVGLVDRLRALDPARRPPPRTEREDHHRTISMGLVPLVLEIADHAAGARRLEPRYPFFDRRLVELCLAFPGDQKLDRGWTRIVLRRAMQGALPRTVQWRAGKADLSPNFLRGLLDGAARPAVERLLADGARVGPYVDLNAVRTAYQRARSPGSESRWAALTVWKVLTLNRWLEVESLSPAHQEVAYGEAPARSGTAPRARASAVV